MNTMRSSTREQRSLVAGILALVGSLGVGWIAFKFLWIGFWSSVSIEPTQADEPRLAAGSHLFGHALTLAFVVAGAFVLAVVGLVQRRGGGWVASAVAGAVLIAACCTIVPSLSSEQAHVDCLRASVTCRS
jgi:hypothetical protein